MKDKLKELINKQINYELESAYLYLNISIYFETNNLNGYSNYYKILARKQIGYAITLIKYLINSNEKIELMSIHAPDININSIEHALNISLSHEELISNKLNELYELANNEKEYSLKVILNWLINIEFNNHANARKMFDDYKLFNNNLYQLDKKYEERR